MTPQVLLIVFLTIVTSLAAAGQSCSKLTACSAQLSRYPQLEEVGLQIAGTPVSPQEASGWGSGMLPLYDELLDEQNPIDYTATPEVTTFSLCDCPGNQTCDSENEARNMQLDNSIRLTFCTNVEERIPNTCTGKRGLIFVIGPADASGNFIQQIDQTIAFCNCPTGFQRSKVEAWQGGLNGQLGLQYKCV